MSASMGERAFLEELAKGAGKTIKEKFYDRTKSTTSKISENDLVTETDVSIEKELISKIKAKYPTDLFICEESSTESTELTSDRTWIIDPIDGTMNFIHSFPFTCVSIGFAVNGRVEAGCVYNPILDELFIANRGGGAFLNGLPIAVSPNAKSLSTALVLAGFCSTKIRKLAVEVDMSATERKWHEQIEEMVHANVAFLLRNCRDIRRTGSAACDLCNVAMGRADAYFEIGGKIWDVAAGTLILEEAGGHVMDVSGGAFGLTSQRLVAVSSKQLGQELCKGLKPPPTPLPFIH
eukprot:Filipodium_phascolosomae@DN1693_c0_g1_i1.p1